MARTTQAKYCEECLEKQKSINRREWFKNKRKDPVYADNEFRKQALRDKAKGLNIVRADPSKSMRRRQQAQEQSQEPEQD